MSRQKSRNTQPEIRLRRVLHGRGLRFRVNFAPEASVRRTPDIVFTRARVVIFVDGCFWHRCPEHRTIPRTNDEWWAAKLARNAQRDRETDASFTGLGWKVVRVWEHVDPEEAADTVESLVRGLGKERPQPYAGSRQD